MKERPILFSGAMVRALLDGSKTQTRRIVKPQPHEDRAHDHVKEHESIFTWWAGNLTLGVQHEARCPYGQPGDRLWVRETWLEDPEDDGTWAYTQYTGCKGSPLSDIPRKFQKPEHCIYREGWDGCDLRWRPSIHMPRWASRMLLEIVSVRVELLQDIGEKDARAEGVTIEDRNMAGYCAGQFLPPSIRAYRDLWESINGAGSWDANPWVWVVEFKRVTACLF